MSFPAIYNGSTLSGNTISSVNVEISDDDGVSWMQATDGGNGVWSVTGLSLTEGSANQIRIRLRVNDGTNDEYKVANGENYQTFTVTP